MKDIIALIVVCILYLGITKVIIPEWDKIEAAYEEAQQRVAEEEQ